MPRVTSILMILAICAPAQEIVEQRREDLAYLAEQLPKRHKDPFTRIDEQAWRDKVRQVDHRLPELAGPAFEVELLKLVALLGDSHTHVRPRALRAGDLMPFAVRWFSDGLYVVKTSRKQRSLLGKKVVRIGSVSVDEAARRLATTHVFDNPSHMRGRIPGLLRLGRLLHALGITPSADKVTLRVEHRGEVSEHEVLAGGFGLFPAQRGPTRSVVTTQRSRWHHHEFLQGEGLLYVQYNRCATSTAHDLGKFSKTLLDLCATGKVKTLVFDVQYNGGGSSMLLDVVLARLAKHEPLRTRRNVFCIIGRRTFSSAILNASTLKRRYGAVLVGEPSGGSPNHFGEIRSFELPRSKLKVSYSTRRFDRGPTGAKTIPPDHAASQSYADFVSGKDPVLDKIRSLVR